MPWNPDLASVPLETLMEEQDVPESDRDEIRRFAEFLERRKKLKSGEPMPPPPEGMKEWLGFLPHENPRILRSDAAQKGAADA